MQFNYSNSLNGLWYGIKTLWILLVLLSAGCSSTSGSEAPSMSLSEAFIERLRIDALENWKVVFDIKTSGLTGYQDDYVVEATWLQEKEDFHIGIAPYKTLEKGDGFKFYIKGRANNNAVLYRFDEKTKQEVDRFYGDDVDYLFGKVVNYSIPLAELAYWLRGLKDPNARVSILTSRGDGRAASIREGGWQVDYLNYERYDCGRSAGLLLPQQIKISSTQIEGFTHEVLIKSWQCTEADGVKLPTE